MKKISTIFLLVIIASFFVGGIKIQAQDLINFNGWEFLSWKTDKENVEKILKEKKIELAKTAELYTWFKYQGMNTWLYYDNNNQLNKILQRNTFSIIEYNKANKFFEKTTARLTKTYGKPNHTKINKQDSVKTFIWELKYTRIELEYDYMYKIIDELGAGSYWVEVNISPGKFESDLVNNEKENSEQLIIGKWELDYKKLLKNNNKKDTAEFVKTKNSRLPLSPVAWPDEKSTIEFFESGKYKRFIWGFESGGTFQIAGNELRLNEKYRIGDKEGSERGKYVLKIEEFKKNKLIISFIECDVKVYQVYQKTKKTVSNNIIKTGTEFEKADDLLIKCGAEKNVFSRKFTKPSVSYMLPNNVGIIIIYDKKEGKNVIVELLKCNNPEAEKDIREWKNVEQIELTE